MPTKFMTTDTAGDNTYMGEGDDDTVYRGEGFDEIMGDERYLSPTASTVRDTIRRLPAQGQPRRWHELYSRATRRDDGRALLRCVPLALAAAILAAPAGACPDAKGPSDGDGLPHGEWRIVHCDGTEATGQFRHGDEHGSWTVRYPDGRTGDGGYANGRKDGPWTYRYPEGSRVHGEYREGLLDGVWTLSDANGATVARECWKNGRRMGAARLCGE